MKGSGENGEKEGRKEKEGKGGSEEKKNLVKTVSIVERRTKRKAENGTKDKLDWQKVILIGDFLLLKFFY